MYNHLKFNSVYYPFGSIMPMRSSSLDKYRYGFNGQERDDEVKGSGNSYDYGSRMYDSRLGRWLSIDPKASAMPSWSPYSAFFNNPIFYIDKGGELPFKYSTEFLNSSYFLPYLRLVQKNSVFQMLKENVENSKYVSPEAFYREPLGDPETTGYTTLYRHYPMPKLLTMEFNPNKDNDGRNDLTRARTLIHEMVHAYLYSQGTDFGDYHNHHDMTNKYRNLIKQGLKEFAKDNGLEGFTDQDFDDMSWVGLDETAEFRKKFNIERDEEKNKILNYTAPDGSKSYSKEYYDWTQRVLQLQNDPRGNLKPVGTPTSSGEGTSSSSATPTSETPDGPGVPSF